MKEIALTNGGIAIVDDEDYDAISQSTWYKSGDYAANTRGATYMHTVILGHKSGFECDHINGNGLDNRRQNLRHVTRSLNMANTGPRFVQYKGVHKNGNRWRAQITVDYKKIHLGYFDLKEDAAKAYDEAARRYFGEHAYTNF